MNVITIVLVLLAAAFGIALAIPAYNECKVDK